MWNKLNYVSGDKHVKLTGPLQVVGQDLLERETVDTNDVNFRQRWARMEQLHTGGNGIPDRPVVGMEPRIAMSWG